MFGTNIGLGTPKCSRILLGTSHDIRPQRDYKEPPTFELLSCHSVRIENVATFLSNNKSLTRSCSSRLLYLIRNFASALLVNFLKFSNHFVHNGSLYSTIRAHD